MEWVMVLAAETWRRRLASARHSPVIATPRMMAVTGAIFYLTGAVVAANVALSAPEGAVSLLTLWCTVAGAVVAGVLVGFFGERLPPWVFHALNLLGTVLVTVMVYSAGQDAGAEALAVLFVCVPLDSYFFFPLISATLYQAFGALSLVLLAATGHIPQTEAVALVLGNVVIGLVVAWLVRAAAAAETDPVTGLTNRDGFHRATKSALSTANRLKTPLSVGYLEVGHSDPYDGAHDTTQPDPLMRAVAASFRGVLPGGAMIARLGEWGFGVLLPGLDAHEAHAVLQQMNAAVAIPGVTMTGGITDAGPDDNPLALIFRASAAQLEAGSEGPMPIVVSATYNAAIAELADAIADGQLRLFYQPIVSLPSGEQVGAEALVRWEHPTRGLVPPNDFIPLAESGSLICALGHWVLEQACADATKWSKDLKVTVNVSGMQLAQPGFAREVFDVLAASGLPPHRLVIEVTETTLDGESTVALRNLRTVRSAGVRVALDDFGTGYSSLSRLDTLPIDTMKLDRSFIARLTTADSFFPVIAAACAMGQALGLRIVAEGIENSHQAKLLASYGCHEGQGYYFGRPVPEARPTEEVFDAA
jgi:EAL domain-containing protein (putative c-di-GMP-specific phosphodiesterase class I)